MTESHEEYLAALPERVREQLTVIHDGNLNRDNVTALTTELKEQLRQDDAVGSLADTLLTSDFTQGVSVSLEDMEDTKPVVGGPENQKVALLLP